MSSIISYFLDTADAKNFKKTSRCSMPFGMIPSQISSTNFKVISWNNARPEPVYPIYQDLYQVLNKVLQLSGLVEVTLVARGLQFGLQSI